MRLPRYIYIQLLKSSSIKKLLYYIFVFHFKKFIQRLSDPLEQYILIFGFKALGIHKKMIFKTPLSHFAYRNHSGELAFPYFCI